MVECIAWGETHIVILVSWFNKIYRQCSRDGIIWVPVTCEYGCIWVSKCTECVRRRRNNNNNNNHLYNKSAERLVTLGRHFFLLILSVLHRFSVIKQFACMWTHHVYVCVWVHVCVSMRSVYYIDNFISCVSKIEFIAELKQYLRLLNQTSAEFQ